MKIFPPSSFLPQTLFMSGTSSLVIQYIINTKNYFTATTATTVTNVLFIGILKWQ